MFDAGAIQAHLDIETSAFDTKLRAAEDRVKAFESGRHEVKISAVFDNASLGRARQMFTALDQQLSRDAMARLRSSPQGSVLGALNALFSPHPVTGAPSPQQAASSGLLGKMISQPGGGGPVTAQNQQQRSLLGNLLTGSGGGGKGLLSGLLIGGITGKTAGASDQAVRDATRATENLAEATRADAVATSDSARATRDAAAATRGLAGLFKGGSAGSFGKGLAGGIGPGILGLGLKTSGIVGAGGSLLGALPALFGGLSPLLPAAAGVGALALAFKGASSNVTPLTQLQNQIQNEQTAGLGATAAGAKQIAGQQQQLTAGLSALPPAQKQMYQAIVQIQNAWQTFTGNMAPLFGKALTSVASLFQSLMPELKNFFSAAGTLIQPLIGAIGDLARQWLPLLAQGFRAAAPVIRPLIDGIGSLVTGLLPGLNTLVKASAPAVAALASVFSTLGKDIGQMFAIFAPVLTQSSVILKALFDVVSALFPIIGQLAAVFARALAPVFLAFANTIRALLPFLTIIGRVLAALAGAILGDLVSALTALAQLLQAIAPALSTFATVLSQAFNVLENTGVFAILGDALEGLVKPLATLIDALLKGLTPILGPLISFVSRLSTILINGLVQAITAVLPPLTTLATTVLSAIALVLPVILPLLTSLVSIFTGAVVAAVSSLATALAAVLNAIPPPVLRDIVVAILAVVAAVKLWTIAQGLLDTVISANPIGLLVIAIAGITIAIVEMVKHWREIWTEVKNIADDAWHFLDNILHNDLVQALLGVFTLGLAPLALHWQTVWDTMKSAASTVWNGIQNDILHPLINFFTTTIPNAFKTSVSAISSFWSGLTKAVEGPVNAVIGILNDLIGAFDDITNALGLGKPIGKIPLLGGGGGGGSGGGTSAAGTPRQGTAPHARHGMRIPGWGGGDRQLIMAEAGETVLPKEATLDPLTAALAAKYGIPGFQGGGIIGTILGAAGRSLLQLIPGLAIGAALTTSAAEGLLSRIAGKSSGAGGELGAVLKAVTGTVLKDMESWLTGHKTSGSTGGSGGGFSGPGGGQPSANAALARRLYPAWATGANWLNWNNVAMAESGWNNFIWNAAGSGAYGIAQALPFTKYPKPGWPASAGGTSNPTAQISWMHDYILNRYGSPAAAWQHEQSQHWYGGGTQVNEPVIGFGARSGRMYGFGESGPELVTPGGRDVMERIADLIKTHIDVTAQVPRSTAGHLGEVFGGVARNASFRNRYPAGGW